MALYIVQVPDPPPGVDWLTAVPGQYLYNVTGITATLSTGAGQPTVMIDASSNGFDGTYQNTAFHTLVYGQPGLVAGNACVRNVSPMSNDAIAAAPTVIDPPTQGFGINVWASKLHASPAEAVFDMFDSANPGNNISFTAVLDGVGNITLALEWRNPLPDSIQVTLPGVQAVHMLTVEVDVGAMTGQFYLDGNPFGAAQPLPATPFPSNLDTITFGRAGNDTISYDEVSLVAGADGAAFWASLFAAASVSFAAYSFTQINDGPLNYYHLDETVVVGGRQVALNITDGTKRVEMIPTGFPEVATPGPYAYSWVPRLGNAAEAPDGKTITIPTPPLILPAGYSIGTNTLDLTPTDQWSNIAIWWDSNIMDAQAAQSAYLFPPPVHLVYHQEPH